MYIVYICILLKILMPTVTVGQTSYVRDEVQQR
jgi:hypothetical protein